MKRAINTNKGIINTKMGVAINTKIGAILDKGAIECGNVYNPKCSDNKELLKIEELNRIELGEKPSDDQYLYPDLNDPNFNIKIKNKKEFSDTKYDGTIAPIAEHANELSNADYELQPQQAFVRNFMSFQTPYNSLLLFHGLGSGKTCSAIGVCEEMRDYLKQMGLSKRIIIVASPNVQDNFRLQLFDERKLKNVDGLWTMKGCLGNKLLKEINPTGMKGLTREKVIQQVKNIISTSYYFVGYLQFSNDIARHWKEGDTDAAKTKNLQNEYSDRLIVIDEVHNIRISDDNDNKNVAKNLMYLVSIVDNLRLLLLSATPMFNSYKEIVWLLNLMNMNDRRGIIGISDIFDVKTGKMTDEGRDMLIKKANGYISYVRGENPYTFPFRVYPNQFATKFTFNSKNEYPDYQINGRPIKPKNKIQKLSLFLTPIGEIQEMGYNYIIDRLRSREERVKTTKTGQERILPSFKSLKSFGYTDLQIPIEALNIIYPHEGLEALSKKIRPFEPLDEEDEDEEDEDEEEEDENLDADDEANLSPHKSNINDIPDEIDEVFSNGPVESQVEEPIIDDDAGSSVEKEGTLVDTTSATTSARAETLIDSTSPISPRAETLIDSTSLRSPISPRTSVKEGLHNIEGSTISDVETVKNPVISVPVISVAKSKSNKIGGLKFALKAGAKNAVVAGAKPAIEFVVAGEKERERESISSNIQLNINPRELTGTDGLKRVMLYDDSVTPAIKGNFQYRDGFEPIFKQKNIGKYSSKIASICDYIYGNTLGRNIDSEAVAVAEVAEVAAAAASEVAKASTFSDGIILIYSSYIDGGLIPMALALEEMGFARFGKNASPLFKKPPTAIVDVSKSKKTFKPARYAMITGDKRLSPNNDADIKVITDDNNIYGEEVKVILLSQAGSEGLDFKAIRQIHILDPWYNVSRMEQIIGRGVRNFSHKDLPFNERNVQIFLYGTMLSNTKEEAADLYIYRISEIKAVKIGKVTRLLKQISVDCHINHDQTKLTTKNFIKDLGENAKVEQILSNHEQIEEFLVGDVDNSATCDYQSCSFECLPDIKKVDIVNDKFNLNTYNEAFMLVNSEKIIQRIRMLFNDRQDGRFFYKKKTLMFLIKQEHNYPTHQIYAALTQMITDNSEFITDKYGRTGHLINIGEYYLFQPSELNYPNISIFDRSRPLDYKHDTIHFEIKTDIAKPVIDQRNITPKMLEDTNKIKGISVLDKMFFNYILATFTQKVSKGDNNWYEHCSIIMRKMVKDTDTIISGSNENEKYDILKLLLIEHIVDELMMLERIDLMNYYHQFTEAAKEVKAKASKAKELETEIPESILKNILNLYETLKISDNTKSKQENDVENTDIIKDLFNVFTTEVRKYLYSKIILANKGRLSGIVIFDGPSSLFSEGVGISTAGASTGNLNVFILRDKTWVPAEPEDKRDFEPVIEKKYKLKKEEKTKFNRYVGFIGFENSINYMIFKLKDTSAETNTAYRCDQSGKKNIIIMLNDIEKDVVEQMRFFNKAKNETNMNQDEYKELISKITKPAIEMNEKEQKIYTNLIKKIKLAPKMSEADAIKFVSAINNNPFMSDEDYNRLIKKTLDGAFELCIREEFTLRSFQRDEDKKDKANRDTIWFLDTETAIYNEFEKRERNK